MGTRSPVRDPSRSLRPLLFGGLIASALVLISRPSVAEESTTGAANATWEAYDAAVAKAWEAKFAGRFEEGLLESRRALALVLELGDAPNYKIHGTRADVRIHEEIVSLSPAGQEEIHAADEMSQPIRSALRRREYAKAESLATEQLGLRVRHLGPRAYDVAESQRFVAQCLTHETRWAEADSLYLLATAIYNEYLGERHPNLATILADRASNAQEAGRRGDAEALLTEGIGLLRERGWENHPLYPLYAYSLTNLSVILRGQGELARAETVARQALALLRPRTDHQGRLASALSALGQALYEQGRHEEAREPLDAALSIRIEKVGPGDPDVARSRINVAANLRALSEYAEAESHLRRAIAVRDSLYGPSSELSARARLSLASLLDAKGHTGDAEDSFGRALGALGSDPTALRAYGDFLRRHGRPAEAESSHRLAIAEYRRREDPRYFKELPGHLRSLAIDLYAEGRFPEAESLLAEASVHFESARLAAGDRFERATFDASPYPLIAAIHLARGDSVQAWEALERSLGRAFLDILASGERPVPPETARRRKELLGRLEEAESRWSLLGIVDTGTRGLTGDAGTSAVSGVAGTSGAAATSGASGATSTSGASGAAATSGALSDAATSATSGASGAAATSGASGDAGTSATSGAPPVPAGSGASRTSAASDVLEPMRSSEDPRNEELRRALLEVQAEWTRFQEDQREAYPFPGEKSLGFQELRSHLAPTDAMLGWFDIDIDGLPPQSWTYVLRSDGLYWFSHPASGDAGRWSRSQSALKELRESFFGTGWSALGSEDEASEALVRISRDRWQIAMPALESAERIVVVGTGVLDGVPIDVLLTPEGEPVVDRWTITTAPSASVHVWLAERSRIPHREPTSLFAVADPLMEASPLEDLPWRGSGTLTPMLRGVAHTDPGAPVGERREPAPSLRGQRRQWTPVPASREEVAAITPYFARSGLAVGRAASESELFARSESGALREFDVIHIATHAFADDRNPDRSALVLAEVGRFDPLDPWSHSGPDGFLTAREVRAGWGLDAELVVLSACESALGTRIRGEGFVGLTQSFLLAGSRNVLASLWPVEDEATRLLMERFYRIWIVDGEVGPTALRQAKRELRDLFVDGRRPYAHPHSWAAFVWVGPGD